MLGDKRSKMEERLMVKKAWAALLITLVLAGCGVSPAQKQPDTSAQKPQWSQPPQMQIDPQKTYIATLQTSLGDMQIRLFTKDAPRAVNNFVFLARQGFYDGTIFHRIMKDFMIQGGDPTGTGTGGPGYRVAGEPVKRSYDPGIIAYANSGHPDSQGSQFFICSESMCKNLDAPPYNIYTQFGQVEQGMDVLQKLASVTVKPSPRNEMSVPVNPPVLIKVLIDER
jgi:cyclophilin family peptidyl-prolyl cis-trans isomerase